VEEHRRKDDSRNEDCAEDDQEEQTFGHTSPLDTAARNSLIGRAPAAARLN
jgi:hypothetical protein